MINSDSNSPILSDEDLQNNTNSENNSNIQLEEESHESIEDIPISPPVKKSLTKNQTIHERSLHGIQIFIARNAYPRSEPKRYILTTFEKLLSDSMDLVGLNSQAKKVFTKDGKLVKSIDEMKEKELFYISSGEKFGYGSSPTKKKLPKYDDVRSPKSDSENSGQRSPKSDFSPSKTKEQLKLDRKQNSFRNEILSFQRTLTFNSKTIEQCIRESCASVYAQNNENQRLSLPQWGILQSEHDQTQLSLLIDHLVQHHICQSSSVNLPQTEEWSMNLLKKISVEEIKFAFFGSRQSGKTTAVHIFTTMLMRKLQQSDIASTYLFFPMNFEILTIEFSNVKQILRLYIKNTFDALEYSHMAFVPIIAPLRKWFTFISFGSTAQFPVHLVKQFPEIDSDKLQELAKNVNKALFANNGKYAIKDFLDTVFSIPSVISSALGLSGVIYIFDHFEYADKYLFPSEDCFPDAVYPSSISESLCKELSKHPYIVSYQEEKPFLNCFVCEDAELIDLAHSVEGDIKVESASPKSKKSAEEVEVPKKKQLEIVIRHPTQVRITEKDCTGYPGLIEKYRKVVKLISSYNEHKVSIAYEMARSSTERFNEILIKKEVIRLSTLLFKSGSKIINEDILNKFIEEDVIIANLNEKEDKPKKDSFAKNRQAV